MLIVVSKLEIDDLVSHITSVLIASGMSGAQAGLVIDAAIKCSVDPNDYFNKAGLCVFKAAQILVRQFFSDVTRRCVVSWRFLDKGGNEFKFIAEAKKDE